MNKTLSLVYVIIASLLISCGGSEENKNSASEISASHGQKYLIDTAESLVTWKGSMVIGSSHTGYVHISQGELMVDNGQLTGGTAKIDMNSIEYADKEEKNSPVFHLKSADYFDVEKFPISSFSIARVEPEKDGNAVVTGNLTIKGVTNGVTFPATVDINDGIVTANGTMVIDRTDWGIRYRSGKFYDKLADQAVSDKIEFVMKIVAKK